MIQTALLLEQWLTLNMRKQLLMKVILEYRISGGIQSLLILFMYSDLVVSVDTGSVHISSAKDIPIIAIYLVTIRVNGKH